LDLELVFKTYESSLDSAKDIPEGFTEQNIKDLYWLKSQLVSKNLKRVQPGDTATPDPAFGSLMSLLGGFDGLSSLLSEVAIMKNTIKGLNAEVDTLKAAAP
jgi:hypothetical protein